MLVSVSKASPLLSPQSVAVLVVAACCIFLVPTFRAAPAVAQQQPPASENGNGDSIDGKEVVNRPSTPAEKLQTVETGKATTITEGTERGLRWGEPANGLRAAIAIRRVPGKPKTLDSIEFPNELYLVLQNVSDAAIRLLDKTVETNLRELHLKYDGVLEAVHADNDPTGINVVLRSREVVFLPMFTPDTKSSDKASVGSIWAEEVLKDAHITMIAKMHVNEAPAGAWTGNLRTGEASGEAAAGKRPITSADTRTAKPDANDRDLSYYWAAAGEIRRDEFLQLPKYFLLATRDIRKQFSFKDEQEKKIREVSAGYVSALHALEESIKQETKNLPPREQGRERAVECARRRSHRSRTSSAARSRTCSRRSNGRPLKSST